MIKKIIGFILALAFFSYIFLFFEIWKDAFIGGWAEVRTQESFKYFPIGCGVLFLIAFLKRMYRKFLR